LMTCFAKHLTLGITAAALTVFRVCGVAAADLPPPSPPAVATSTVVYGPPVLYHPEHFELRGGLFAHAIASPEAGSVDANVEVVAPRFFTIPGLPDYFTPRLHAGIMANFAGRTSYV
jgi:hypothetical protein